jgi:hypothetical protein
MTPLGKPLRAVPSCAYPSGVPLVDLDVVVDIDVDGDMDVDLDDQP